MKRNDFKAILLYLNKYYKLFINHILCCGLLFVPRLDISIFCKKSSIYIFQKFAFILGIYYKQSKMDLQINSIFFLLIIFLLSKIGESLNCYQCTSSDDIDCVENFDWDHASEMELKPTPCEVEAARYCIKTTGVWGGVAGTTRFCSSRDMFNTCQYVGYKDHNRLYRACIYTCNSDGCNGTNSNLKTTGFMLFLMIIMVTVATFYITVIRLLTIENIL